MNKRKLKEVNINIDVTLIEPFLGLIIITILVFALSMFMDRGHNTKRLEPDRPYQSVKD